MSSLSPDSGLLVIFSGLPGTGKTTVAAKLARTFRAVYLRIDSLETALVRSGLVDDQWDIGPSGYCAAQAIACDNLKNGAIVVADCVNPLRITRDAWRGVASSVNAPFLKVEVVCSDTAEHRRRVENRESDIEGHRQPSWQEILDREYEPWDRERLVIDTSKLTPDQSIASINRAVRAL